MGSGSSKSNTRSNNDGKQRSIQEIGSSLNYGDDEMDTLDNRRHKLEHENASEALLLEAIQKVKPHQKLPCMSDSYIILKEILHILRDNKLKGGGSRDLNYDVSDVVELAQELIDNCVSMEMMVIIITGVNYQLWCCLKGVKTRMLLSESTMTTSENIIADGEVLESSGGEDVVGLEDVIERLLQKEIFSEEPALSKLVIEGMTGLGKTALVRKLYNHTRVVDKFERRAWLQVPSDFSHKGVLVKLIQLVVDGDDDGERSSLEETMMHSSDIQTLQQMLHQKLLGRQYLIVIDDLPEEMDLVMIYKSLPNEDKGSRVILTRRFDNVHVRATPYKMKPLNSDHSWELFMKTIFGGNKFTSDHDEFPKPLERKAKEVLRRCGGIPSAIKNVGMQVARMRETGIEWEQLLESIDFDGILDIFEDSYRKLEPHTKTCFMHLACFKENATMGMDKLEHLLDEAAELEYDARSGLHSLIEQSLLEFEKRKMDDHYKSCRMNDMLHRLSIKKAEEGIGFEILSNDGGRSNRTSQSPRHRVIKCSRERFDYSTDEDKHLVSLFFHGGGSYLDDNPSYWKSFEKLKILHLEDFRLKILPESIGLLTKLTYLGLKNNYIRALPRSMRKLKKLKVLDITQNFMVEVPDFIWKMDSLLRLYMSGVICPKPLRVDVQWPLTTLTYISIDDWTCLISGSKLKITGLEELGIEGLDENTDVRKLFASLDAQIYMHRLILKGFRFKRMPCLDELRILEQVHWLKLDGFLARLPRRFPSHLYELKLVNTCLDKDPMPVLGKLPELTSLKLENAFTGQEMKILDGEFPKLDVLIIKDLRYLRNLRVGKGAMAKLKKVEINNCPYLETLPAELGSMADLQWLTMVTTKKIEKKIRELGYVSKIYNLSFHT